MKVTTAAEMREIDRATTDRFGVPSLTLMENAGSAVAQFILHNYSTANRVVVICGRGNNGGDGFVVARKLHRAGRVVEVLLLAPRIELRGDALAMFERLPLRPIEVTGSVELKAESSRSLANCDLMVDAILGTGLKPPVTGLYAEAIALMNRSDKPVIAVDIPSGADSDAMAPQNGSGMVHCDAIVTFTSPRPAHVFGELTNGPIVVAPIGSPPAAIVSSLNLEVTTPRDFASLLVLRPRDSNKGIFGHVLIVGGSFGKSGAAAMAGMAALRAGAGLSTVATPARVLTSVASFAAELMTEPLPETSAGSIAVAAAESGRFIELTKPMTVVAIGPGIGRNPETVRFVHEAVHQTKVPLVLDADGLNAFEGTHPVARWPPPSAGAHTPSRRDVAPHRHAHQGNSSRPHQRRAQFRSAASSGLGPQGRSHHHRDAGWHRLGESHRQSGYGDRRHRRYPDRHDRRRARPNAPRLRARGHCCGLPAWTGRRRGGEKSMGEHSLVATDLLDGLPEAFRRATQWAAEETVRIG